MGRYAPQSKKRIKKIPGGVDPVFRPPQAIERAQARSALGYYDADFVCLLLGRLSWNKGHDILIEAARIVDDQNPALNIKCLFVGEGRHAQEIKNLVSSEELDRGLFKFMGYLPRAEQSMWAADLFILPSRVEGFALVVAEAMATGLVPIRTPSGGALDQIIEGETGLLIPFEDAKALARAVVSLRDAEKRKMMSANCIARASEWFSAEASCNSTRAVYAQLSRRPQG